MNKAISRFSLGASAHELERRLPVLELNLAERAGSHPISRLKASPIYST